MERRKNGKRGRKDGRGNEKRRTMKEKQIKQVRKAGV